MLGAQSVSIGESNLLLQGADSINIAKFPLGEQFQYIPNQRVYAIFYGFISIWMTYFLCLQIPDSRQRFNFIWFTVKLDSNISTPVSGWWAEWSWGIICSPFCSAANEGGRTLFWALRTIELSFSNWGSCRRSYASTGVIRGVKPFRCLHKGNLSPGHAI